MKNADRFLEVAQQQPDENWTRGPRSKDGKRCVLMYVFDTMGENLAASSFALWHEDLVYIAHLNDTSETRTQALERITEYITVKGKQRDS